MKINKVDIDKFKETIENAKNTGKKTVEVTGEWRIGKEGPQFESKIKTEKGGEFTLVSDETIMLGGGGTAPNPVQYCIYGLIACFSATFAKWAAMQKIELKSLSVKATANMDLTRAFGISMNPILETVKLDLVIDTDASMEEIEKLNETAKERCPGYYCLTHAIFPDIKITKK